ncbi:MAG: hypothetical protein GF418_07320 [Chitinivibrionales bacterium]|nr:hypothetical protein [Chitinivibrionales bacterium]MBD3395421.1 hypothetical protein [Chitinivibrionales bacterium]
MKAKTAAHMLLALVVCLGCVSKETVRIRVKEADELPRGRKVKYEGGMGESREDAVVIIGAEDLKQGVAAEYDFISQLHGRKNKDWRVKAQSQSREGGKIYDIIEMEILESGETHYYYFDISNCSWVPRRQ